MRTKRSFISILLCLALILSCFATFNILSATAADTTKKTTTANDYGLMNTVQGSTILQAWDWSYKNVEANIETIAEQGFTTVQVSPASVLNGTSAGSTFNEAWKVYQPGVLKMNAGTGMPDNNVLGTKAEFTSMCNKAHQYGVKIIVDTVLNHLGGDKFTESDTNPLNHLTSNGYYPQNYQSELYNRSCFHDYHILDSTHGDWDSDWDMTQYAVLNLPDLNTSNSTVQTAAYNYLKELVDAGADGFRFDAAKHIETPQDRNEIKSDFWPNTIKKLQNNYSSKEIYAYGEILGVGSRSYSWYKPYMDITDSGTSDSIRNAIANHTVNGATPWLPSGVGSVDEIVLWDESHDNFENGSYGTPVGQIGKIWALEAGRANTTSVYLARPGNDSGYKSVTLGAANLTAWSNDTTKAVNQFHNYFNGQNEYTSTSGSIAYIERGTTGAVLVNTSDNYGSVSVDKHTLEDGSYKDAITGNTFTVANNKISGSIGNTGVAVIYKDGLTPDTPAAEIEVRSGYNTIVFTNNKGWGTPNVYYWGGSGANSWPGTAMDYCGTNEYSQKQYVGYVPTTCKNIIINDGSNQSADSTISGHTGLYLKDTQVSGNYELGTFDISSMLPGSPTDPSTDPSTEPETQPVTESAIYLSVPNTYETGSPNWYIWTWGSKDGRAVKGTKDSTSGYYKFTDFDSNVIFLRIANGSTFDGSNWSNPPVWNKTDDLTVPSGKNLFTINGWLTGTWSKYTPPAPKYDYTVNYTYDVDGTTKTITKQVLQSELTDANQIAAINDPSSKLKDPSYTYTLGKATKSGTTITAPLTKSARTYTVKVNGNTWGTYSFLEQAEITSTGGETGFVMDGKLVYYGTKFKVYVTGNLNITTDSSATHEDVASINHIGTTVSNEQLSLELLATANVDGFKSMGVAYAMSARTADDIYDAVTTVSDTSGSYNKIGVHKSAVDYPNSSGQYQFRYAPRMSISKIKANSTMYFYTYAVTDSGFVVSDAQTVNISSLIA